MNYRFADDLHNPHLGGNIVQGDPWACSPLTWQYLIDRFAVRSVLDLGSGLGYAADYFARRGVYTLAVDGMRDNVLNAVYPTIELDLTKAPVTCKVDLVYCLEVVEHIEEKYLDNVLGSLACGRFVAMSHALPGQGGYHHVNCKGPEYWISHMSRFGFVHLDVDTARIREFAAKDGAAHMQRSGLVFARR